MIKTVDGRTKVMGGEAELLTDFMGTAEALLRRTKITAEQMHQAIKLAEMANEVVEKIGECVDDFDDEELETENEPAEEKTTAKKRAVKVTTLGDDDLDEMLEWLKGELEELKERFDD